MKSANAISSHNYIDFYKFCNTLTDATENEILFYLRLYEQNKDLVRFAPIFYQKLKKSRVAGLAENQSFARVASHALVIISDIEQIITKLNYIANIADNLHIPIVLLKSTGLNGSVYFHENYRGCSDIDILIREKDRECFEEALSKEAVKLQSKDTNPFSDFYETSWHCQKTNKVIDLHTKIINPYLFDIDYETLFDNSISHPSFESSNVRLLANHHQLIHAALHMFNDANFSSQSMYDFIFINTNCNIEIDALNKDSSAWDCEKLLFFCYKLSNISSLIKYKGNHLFSLYFIKKLMLNKTKKGSLKRRTFQLLLILIFKSIKATSRFFFIYLSKL